jgi:CHAD domain-containing protein
MSATTEQHAVPPVEPIRYAEHEKLGVLGASQPVLQDDARLRAALISEFRAAAEAAKAAAASLSKGAPAAVHASRKALRRARAILALVSSTLPKGERRAVRDALREARRGLGGTRDHAVAPDTLAQLPLGADERETAARILANAGQAMPPAADVAQLLEHSAKLAAAQADALEAALPPRLRWRDLERGLRAVYAEARDARRDAKRSLRAFHQWRRRSKELVYQLELVAKHAGARVAQIYATFDGVTDTASGAVDLIMLREFVHTYAEGVDPAQLANLEAAIDTQLEDLMKSARKIGRDAFDRSATKFAKKLSRAVAKDLAPPEPGPEHDSGDADHS